MFLKWKFNSKYALKCFICVSALPKAQQANLPAISTLTLLMMNVFKVFSSDLARESNQVYQLRGMVFVTCESR